MNPQHRSEEKGGVRMRAILVCLVWAMFLMLGAQLSAAQTTGHSPRGYPYNSKTCAGGFRACVNQGRMAIPGREQLLLACLYGGIQKIGAD
jgi:hypothetical protein